ncbi:unnamed protein product [Rodentolepis nana]|uniref:Ras-GAP domain-containing protein n=1 Tax=Rodentolepis nana TaxID=102285 RepID=A0A0R3TK74_RODNA|nr:unnamed protein product [Rodentolepis nana]
MLPENGGSTDRRPDSLSNQGQIAVPSHDIAPSHHKSSLLRSTFARMRQVATGTMNSSSSSTTTTTTTTPAGNAATTTSSSSSPLATPSSGASATSTSATPARSGFHQRLSHFSQTFTHDKLSPRRQKLDQIHRSSQSCQTPPSSDVVTNSETASCPQVSNKKKTQLHLHLTAVLEPNNSFLQSFTEEVPVNGKSPSPPPLSSFLALFRSMILKCTNMYSPSVCESRLIQFVAEATMKSVAAVAKEEELLGEDWPEAVTV